MKHIDINLTKYIKALYNGKYKALRKEIIEDTRRRKDLHVHGLAGLIA
jgi:hypothetical protein